MKPALQRPATRSEVLGALAMRRPRRTAAALAQADDGASHTGELENQLVVATGVLFNAAGGAQSKTHTAAYLQPLDAHQADVAAMSTNKARDRSRLRWSFTILGGPSGPRSETPEAVPRRA